MKRVKREEKSLGTPSHRLTWKKFIKVESTTFTLRTEVVSNTRAMKAKRSVTLSLQEGCLSQKKKRTRQQKRKEECGTILVNFFHHATRISVLYAVYVQRDGPRFRSF